MRQATFAAASTIAGWDAMSMMNFDAGQMAQAYLLYSQAAAMSPQNKTYWQRSLAVRTRAALEAKVAPPTTSALDEPDEASDEPPLAPLPIATASDRAEARKLLPPVELQAQVGRQDFDLRGDAKALFEKVAKSFGLDCLFDDDYQAGASFRFQMAGVDYRDALHDRPRAREAFERMWATNTTTRLRDDAMWSAALIAAGRPPPAAK